MLSNIRIIRKKLARSTALLLTVGIPTRQRLVRSLFIGVAVINLLVCGMVGLALLDARTVQHEQAAQMAKDFTAVLAEGLTGFIDKVDVSLSVLNDEISRQEAGGGLDPVVLNAFLARQDARLPGLFGHRVVNAGGVIEYAANNAVNQRANIGDRDFFVALRDNPDSGLVISQPMLGRFTAQWGVVMAKRRNHPDGSFAGVVMVLVPVDYIYKALSVVELGQLGTVTLFSDYSILARYQPGLPVENSIGRSTPSDALRALIQSGQSDSAYHARSGTDQVLRTFHFRTIQGTSLHLVIGLADDEYLAKWRQQAVQMGALALLLCLTIDGFSWLGYRRWQQYRQTISERTRLLARSNADLEQFTEILAHHLQEPVRLQMSFALRLGKVLSSSQLTPDAQQALSYITRGAERLRMLLRDVQLYLALARSPWQARSCDTGKALAVALARLNDKIAKAKAVIHHDALPKLMIDQDRLVDVFAALIDNSLSYGRQGVAPVIRISAELHGDAVVIAVEDNGIGIAEKFRERVFNVFERLHPENGSPGTGIGLALVRKIIDTAGGRIWVDAASGGGTRVLFSLTACKE